MNKCTNRHSYVQDRTLTYIMSVDPKHVVINYIGIENQYERKNFYHQINSAFFSYKCCKLLIN